MYKFMKKLARLLRSFKRKALACRILDWSWVNMSSFDHIIVYNIYINWSGSSSFCVQTHVSLTLNHSIDYMVIYQSYRDSDTEKQRQFFTLGLQGATHVCGNISYIDILHIYVSVVEVTSTTHCFIMPSFDIYIWSEIFLLIIDINSTLYEYSWNMHTNTQAEVRHISYLMFLLEALHHSFKTYTCYVFARWLINALLWCDIVMSLLNIDCPHVVKLFACLIQFPD